MVFNPKTFTMRPGKAPEPKTVKQTKLRGGSNKKNSNVLKKVKTTKKLNIKEANKKKKRGEKYLKLENYTTALKNFNESIETNNSDFETYLLRGDVKILLNNFDGVMDDYREAEKWGASDFELLGLKLRLEIAKKRFNEAIKSLSEFMKLNYFWEDTKLSFLHSKQEFCYCYKLRGYCYEQTGNYELALNDLTTFIDFVKDELTQEEENLIFGKKEIPEMKWRIYTTIAELNYKFKKYKESIESYDSLLKIVEKEDQIIFLREEIAKISIEIFNYGESIAQYSKLIADFPYNYEFYEERAKVKKLVNDDEGFKIDEKIAKLIKKTFKEEEELGNYQTIDLLNKLIKIDGNNITFYRQRALSFMDIDEKKLAILDWTKLISLEPKNLKNYYERGNLNTKLGDLTSALSDFSKAIEINPNDEILYLLRANIWKGLENYDAAKKDLQFVENTNDFNIELFCYLGLAETEIKKNFNEENIEIYNAALDYCKKLINLEPDLPMGYAINCYIYTKCKLPLISFKRDIVNSIDLDPEYRNLSRYLDSDEINKLIDFYNYLEDQELKRQEKQNEKELIEFMAKSLVQLDEERLRKEQDIERRVGLLSTAFYLLPMFV